MITGHKHYYERFFPVFENKTSDFEKFYYNENDNTTYRCDTDTKECHYYYKYESTVYVLEGIAGNRHFVPDSMDMYSNLRPFSVISDI